MIGVNSLGQASALRPFQVNYLATLENLALLEKELNLQANSLSRYADNRAVVERGMLAPCDTPSQNPLIDFLQRELHPSGLWKRISRLNDDQATVGCDSVKAGIRDLIK